MKNKQNKLNNDEVKVDVQLIAKSRMLSPSDTAFRLVKMRSVNSGKSILIVIPAASLVSEHELKKLLLKAGGDPSLSKNKMEFIFQEVTKQIDIFILLRYKPGYCGDVYLRVNDKVIGEVKGDKPVLHPDAKKQLPNETKQGTLKEWKINVAVYALHSTRIMLAICSAFSGLLLKLLDMEGGGFHLWGTSNMDKSSPAYILASVAGAPNLIITNWNNTDKNLEEIAVAHNDSTLILDESKLLDKDLITTAKIITNRVHMLTEGKGKARSPLYANNVAEWRLGVFSTGELSFAQHTEIGKIERLEGENVRMIDVPADAGRGMGIFESLPEGMTSSNELAHMVKDVTHRYYGSAKPAFLKRLVADIQDDHEELKNKLEKGINYFLDQHKVNRNSGIDVRIAKRFALAYVSGCLAIKYKILPFEKSDVMQSISKCYYDSLNMPCSQEPALSMLLHPDVIAILKSGEQLNLIKNGDLSKDLIKGASAVLCKVKGKTVLAVDAKLINGIMNPKLRKIVLKKLTQQGVLLSDSQKEYSTVQIRYGDEVIDRRYCFVYDKLADLLSN
ncbi:DUF927 domain-containing protein [Serratia fonticola]|uniref:DUF927 domain-containing protein n=1 Tax=Serratia fonticola TaxID=47917 RepID=UPI00192BC797|nr:DUF927 domain-containing protein [Serratia fonticola]